MVESAGEFLFRKLRFRKYLILEVMMNVERQEVLNFMFTANKASRAFLKQNFIAIRNGFINEGLITYHFYGYNE